MISRKTLLLSLTVFFIATGRGYTQYINIDFVVKAELSTEVIQDLDFGTMASNSGPKSVHPDDINSGILAVQLYLDNNLTARFQTPNYLVSADSGNNDVIPISIYAAYNNTGVNDPFHVTPISNGTTMLSLDKSTVIADQNAGKWWGNLYIYVYGTVEVGDIANGIYLGDVVLSLDYD